MSNVPKYQYHVLTWGGFYNEDYQAVHGLSEGDFFFDTEGEREKFINHRKKLSSEMNAREVVFYKTEGFCCNVRTVLHRVCEYKGVQVYDTYDMGVNYPFDVAEYHMSDKWYLGHNHYPFGDIDYEREKVKVLGQWITGAYQGCKYE